MPHIHTKPGQHDITASAWIFRENGNDLQMLVHMHRKHGKLMQIGGHIELDETPWQTIGHEIPEESGFELNQLSVLQPISEVPEIEDAAVHPIPAISNTHFIGDNHYHSDYGYAFFTNEEPLHKPMEGESTDLRWMTVTELRDAAIAGIALRDVVDIADHLARVIVPNFHKIEATKFSLDKPLASLLQSK